MTSPGTSPGSDLGTGPRARDPLPRWRRVFPGRDDQVREVRRWLTALLPGVPERDDAVVAAVELVTNAIRHTASGHCGLVAVEVTCCGPVLRIAVADDGAPGGPRLAAARGGLAESGRGLHLVRALAASTGVCGDPRGRLVWADIAWTGQSLRNKEFETFWMFAAKAGKVVGVRALSLGEAWLVPRGMRHVLVGGASTTVRSISVGA